MTSRCLMLGALLLAGGIQAETVGDAIGKAVAPPARTEVTGSIDKAREAYADYLSRSPSSPNRATALRRLADLELEAALNALEAGEAASFDSCIALYREFLQSFPADDRVLYQLSRALDNSGETEQALAHLRTLTADFAESPLAAEAWFRQGEMLFTGRDYAGAAVAYRAVYSQHTDTRFETNARYKHSWSLFKTSDYDRAVARFADLVEHVLDSERPVPEQLAEFSRGQREMFDDALRATSIGLAELGGAWHLEVLFDGDTLPPWAYLFYERLGEHYLGEERYADAAGSFGAFVDRVPTDTRAPILQARVIETYEAAGFSSKALEARADFVRTYGLEAAFWSGREASEYPEITAQLDRHLELLTEHYHAQAQAGAGDGAVDAAVGWYRTWLRYFPDAPDTPGRNFLLAELLFDASRFDDAAIEYERTAYEYPDHERGAEAGYAALLARDRARDNAGADDAGILRQLALDSRLRFADRWPADARTPPVLLSAAEELFATGNLTDAIVAAARALHSTGVLSADQERTAWVVRAHAQFDLADFRQAETAYRAALAATPSDNPMTPDLQARLAASVYELGRTARDAGDLAGATDHFLRVGELGFASTVHPVALFDASAALIELERWDEAAESLQAFRQRYPQHDLAAGIAEQLTGVYLQGGRPLDAAAELTAIADSADAPAATAARWQAAELYADNGDAQSHLQMLETLAGAATTPADEAMRAREQLLAAHRQRNDTGAIRYWHEAIVRADAAAGEARSDYSRSLAAQSALALAEPFGEAFAGLTLTLPLERSVPAKKQALETALAAFEQVADYGIAETSTAATFRIAELYRQFGAALMESERPAELDELALEEYELLLEEQAFPFEEKAIEIHEINTSRAATLIYDEWVARSYDQLALLMPARYDRGEHREPLVSQLD